MPISSPGKVFKISRPTVSKHIHHLILIKYAGGNHKLTVRVMGNLLHDGTQTYVYDALNRLTQRGATQYRYDGDGTLVAASAGGSTISYTQDLAAPLSQILQTIHNGSATDYLFGLDRLSAWYGPDSIWYAADALASVRLTLDGGGVLGSTSYDPFGQVESGSAPGFGFTGEMQDSSGMVYLRARWYDPRQGRFGARDPYPGDPQQPYSQHPYQYGLSDPVRMVDRSGWCAAEEWNNHGASCTQAFRQAMNQLNWLPIAHEDLFQDFSTDDFKKLFKWATAGIRISERGLSGAKTVESILQAMELMEDTFKSPDRVRKILALDRTLWFEANKVSSP